MNSTTHYMERALQLAALGLGRVSPNPLVGCVIIKDGSIIGEGYHQQYGGPHAEVNAVNSVSDPQQIQGSTAVVTLEPCSHQGKTPPCADLLIEQGVAQVIVANPDPNPLVGGKGIKKLEAAGIEVVTGIMERESAYLNRRFMTAMLRARPYIILKWAETADGFIARTNYDSKWISNTESRKLVHQWRHQEDAILVGTTTALKDNPRLDVRDWPVDDPAHPARIVIDKKLTLPPDLHLFQGEQATLCFNCIKEGSQGNTTYVQLGDSPGFVQDLLGHLYEAGLHSLIVEGGSKTLKSFIDQDLWDEARIFRAKTTFGQGIEAPLLEGQLIEENKIREDTLTIIQNKQSWLKN